MTYYENFNFMRMAPLLLALEGGLVSNPADPGGTTNFGISQASYPNLNIAQITEDQALNIYFTDYWLANQCDAIPAPLCFLYFDTCVNQGASNAVRILQQTVGVTQDGIVGPATLQACAGLPAAQHYTYLVNRLMVYKSLAGWVTFGDGWTNRLLHLACGLI